MSRDSQHNGLSKAADARSLSRRLWISGLETVNRKLGLHLFGQLKRITAGITRAMADERPIKAVLDPYNPTGSTIHVMFSTSKTWRWQTDARRCHINWVILDSD